jgi:translation initiation factor IF-3
VTLLSLDSNLLIKIPKYLGRRRGGGRKRTFRREDTAPKHRINDMIRVPDVRLVGENIAEVAEELDLKISAGEVYESRLVKQWARNVELDLVEISPNAEPPVVKIIDYKKFLYQQKQREKEMKANTVKTVVKEVRFGPNMGDHDFLFKLRHAREFLEDGAKVKAYVHFRGRSIVFKDRGELLLLRFMKELEDVGTAEAMPKMEKRRMNVMIQPKKSAKSLAAKKKAEAARKGVKVEPKVDVDLTIVEGEEE